MADVYIYDARTESTYAIPEEEAAKELEQPGVSLESAEQRETREYSETAGLGEAAIAAGEGALQGLDPTGLSSVALADLGGEEYLKRRELRSREFAGVSGAAEALTTIGSVVASGGVGGVAKGAGLGARAVGAARSVAKYSPAGLLTSAGRLAEEGVEAGLRSTSLGQTLRGQVAARGLSSATGAALEGAAYGAGSAVHEEALSGGNYDHLAEKMLAGAKNGALFGGVAGGAIGVAGKGLSVLGGKFARSGVSKRLADESWLQSINPTKAELNQLTKGGRHVERQLETGRRLKDMDIVGAGRSKEEMLRRAEAAISKDAKVSDDLIRRLDDMGGKVDDVAAGKLRTQLDEIGGLVAATEKRLATGTEKAAATRFAGEVTELRAALDSGGLTHGELRAFRGSLGESTKWAKQAGDPVQDKFRAAYGAMSETLEESGERIFAAQGTPGFAAQWKESQKNLAAGIWARDALQQNVQRGQANMLGGLTEQLGGLGGVALGGGVIGGLGGAVALGVAKRYGRGVFAEVLDTVARIEKRTDLSVRRFMGRDVTRKALAVTGAVDERKRARESRTNAALGRRKSESLSVAYRRTLGELQRGAVGAVPLTHVSADLPKTGAAADAIGKRASEYLIKAAPTGARGESGLQPHLRPSSPHPADVAKWARKVDIARSPTKILDLLESGELTYDHVDAMKNVWPEMFRDIQERTMVALGERTTAMPYRDRIALGALLDLPTDPSLEQPKIAAVQAMFAARRAAVQPGGGAPASGGAPSTLAAQFKSLSQQIEGGEFAA